MSDIDDLFFRKAEMADFDPIWEIIQQAKAQMRQLGTFQWDATYPLPDDIRRDIQEGVGYVMCVDKQVAVYGVISFKGEPVYEQIADSWSNALPYVVVHRLAVADGMKRRGLAGQFMLRAEALSRREGVYGFRVDTKADNQYMLRLLESQGFRLCGKVYYRNGNERLAFEKILYPETHSFGVEGITIREAIYEDAQAIFEAIDRNRDDLRRWLPFVDGLKTVADEQQFLHPILATPYEKREPVFVLKTRYRIMRIDRISFYGQRQSPYGNRLLAVACLSWQGDCDTCRPLPLPLGFSRARHEPDTNSLCSRKSAK